jgi:hypothetical protein
MAGTAYRTRTATLGSAAEADVLVVHCSDARFQPHFQEWLRDGLGLERYALIAVPGGPHFLTASEYLPKFAWVGWRWVKFLRNVIRPRRIILVAHDDCRWYLDGRFPHHEPVADRQLADLRHVRAVLNERFAPLTVETWFVRRDGEHVVFEPVA